ncbi:hypothetical protein [Latilactobacillus sakei]|uniref:hypothetical protein n=1 Tax=Latilactobacillus sakei TaxID=1599 RepID=UPI0015F649BC|nr:hypothetical protein [Latilactobacillus sakei]QMU86617.1 hypothetical protein H3M14_01100 [Latilactobacillus sakei]
MTSKRNILANFERLFKPTPGHSFTLLVVKDKFSKTYNFYLEDVAGATYSRGLGSVSFDNLDEYKSVLKQLLTSGLPVEYRGFS